MNDHKLGKYTLQQKLATGGMGEIFLAYDPECERYVALKKIKTSLLQHPSIKDRFIREAKLAARLSHPAIIPIYAIHNDGDETYYTMPYVEGETLKDIIYATRKREERGEAPHPTGVSIPHLMRLFLNICQAIGFAHANNILHRDIKSENILVGKFGEVLIIDWGLAHTLGNDPQDEELEVITQDESLTKPGKIVGTVAYMAPERAFNYPSSVQTEIYALGILLYQMLTLTLPFKRNSLREFRHKAQREKVTDPAEASPHRDIPAQLSRCVFKCLAFLPEDRYQSVQQLIQDIERYIEGSPEWTLSQTINAENNEHWEFQENILLARHIAITRFTDVMEWVMLMISKDAFSGNARFEFDYTPSTEECGIGFLCNVPEPSQRKSLEDGYLIWLGNNKGNGCTLFRMNVEVASIPDLALPMNTTHHIAIEKIDNLIRVFVNDDLKLNYHSHIPMVGGHIGLLYKDPRFQLSDIRLLTGSHSVMVNCLSVPDAFFSSQEYDTALEEYRKIAQSFKGRVEGREALFRAGLTLLEQAKMQRFTPERDRYLAQALDEFNKLDKTPGAPLEYLGKSLVYKAENNLEEEVKCLEYGIRKCKKHPLLYMLEDHVLFRLLESAQKDRKTAYHFALIALMHAPRLLSHAEAKELFRSLKHHIEQPYFIIEPDSLASTQARSFHTAILIAFWLANTVALYELINTLPSKLPQRPLLISNALYALKELGCDKLARSICEEYREEPSVAAYTTYLTYETLQECTNRLDKAPDYAAVRHLIYILRQECTPHNAEKLLPFFENLEHYTLDERSTNALKQLYIQALLLAQKTKEAGKFFTPFVKDAIKKSSSPFFPLYGCYLLKTEGAHIAEIHFNVVTASITPPTTALLAHYILGFIDIHDRNSAFFKRAFHWEITELYRYLILYYSCLEKKRTVARLEKQLAAHRRSVQSPFLSQ